jgi:hypothetical protein
VAQDGKHFVLRTRVTGCAGKLFPTLAIALPPNIRAANTLAESSELPLAESSELLVLRPAARVVNA